MHSNRTRWVLLIVGGAILWLAARGRLAAVVHAMEATLPSAGSSTTSVPTATGSGPTSGQPAGFPPAGDFLTVTPTGYASGFSVPGVQALDSTGIQAAGGAYAYADWDYDVPTGSQVKLPGSSAVSYTVLPSWEEGRTAIFKTPNGGVMEFLHLSADSVTGLAGQTVHGGDVIGLSGSPAGPLEAGSGEHLAVVVDPIAGQWLQGGSPT